MSDWIQEVFNACPGERELSLDLRKLCISLEEAISSVQFPFPGGGFVVEWGVNLGGS